MNRKTNHTSALGWIDFSSEYREKVRTVIDLLGERGVVDELGIGMIRDRYSMPTEPEMGRRLGRLQLMRFVVLSNAKAWYRRLTMPKSCKFYAYALGDTTMRELAAIEPNGNRVDILVDRDTHRVAKEAFRLQCDREAVDNGFARMEAGEAMPISEAYGDIRTQINLPQPQQ